LRPGENVVVPALTYGLYAQISATRGAGVHRVRMRELAIDLDALAETAQRVDARIVWICDPNNPTGAGLEPDEWQSFLAGLPEHCVAVVDEAYADFVPPERRIRRKLDIAEGRRVIVLRSFSKLYGLAGLRLGYALVDESLVPYFDLLDEPFNVNCAALAAGCACLRARTAVAARRHDVAAARSALSNVLRDAGFEPLPSEANFVLARVDVDDVVLGDRLAERGILIRPGSDYGLPGYVRVTVGPPPLMERFATELGEVCASLRNPVA
jgi:histidinol-phosphate aminotransferase